VNKTLRERAEDPQYRHHRIIKSCLDKGFEVPASLIVEVLENEIKAVDGQTRTIISGFPNDTEQLLEFEGKVRLPGKNYR
jgi:adenylate kinase family enzyme